MKGGRILQSFKVGNAKPFPSKKYMEVQEKLDKRYLRQENKVSIKV
jgi:hypothetical protein